MSLLKKIIKKILLNNSNFFFSLICSKLYNKNVSFCYHEISPNPSRFQKEYNLNVEPKVFSKQIKILKKIFKKNSFLITFDDGYKGALKNGLKILKKNNIKPIYFICYYCIRNNFPLVSSLVIYLEKNSMEFNSYCLKNNINKPFFLNINNSQLNLFLKNEKLDKKKVLKYQGNFFKIRDLKKANSFFIGNHSYKHYNGPALPDKQFLIDVMQNHRYLRNFKNYVKYFAFTNGRYDNYKINVLKKKKF